MDDDELPALDVVAPPEDAAMIATPFAPFGLKVTVARPAASVLATDGSTVPSVVVKITCVPLCGGVPADSRTCATIVAVPPAAIALVEVVSVIEEPVGARNGVFSQAAEASDTSTVQVIARARRRSRGIMSLNILSAMDLAGQGRFARDDARWRSPRGYAMAALLVSLSIMSVALTVAMPVWKQISRREKEEELIFRGQQYARAIGLFQRKAGPGALPPNFDVLVQQRFLRRKYKDPITNDDFQPLLAGQQGPGSAAPGTAPGAPGGRGGVNAPSTPVSAPGATPGQGANAGGGAVGGIQGVVSKSKDKSLRLFNGRGAYNEWTFVFVPQQQAAGAGGQGGPGGRGGPVQGGPGFPGGNNTRGNNGPPNPRGGAGGGFGTFNPGGAGGPGGPGGNQGSGPPRGPGGGAGQGNFPPAFPGGAQGPGGGPRR